MSYGLLDRQGPQQWPMPEGAAQGQARLYQDHRFATDDGRARFFDTPFVPLAEPRDARFPFSLTTGRLRDQWHGMSRTGTLGRLFGHQAEPSVDLHPQELLRLGLKPGDLVRVSSRRGSLLLPVAADDGLAPAQAHVALHWGDEVLGGTVQSARSGEQQVMAGVNSLTISAFCPVSRQPELKHSAVRLAKEDLPWRLLAAAWLDEDQALAARQQLARLLPRFAFAQRGALRCCRP